MADRDRGDAPEARAQLFEDDRALRTIFSIFKGVMVLMTPIKGLALYLTGRDDDAAMETMTELFHGNE